MKKPFWIPLTVALGTMIVLYGIGSLFQIDYFSFKLSWNYTEVSLFPVFLGVAAGFLNEFFIRKSTNTR
ncbi:hypothetical protein ACFFJI_09055 [Allobacillus sp. GCM10007491]|uniref:ATPase n=1 Tax=Allobacillus saliphilus TaxID=2912308 RepID=A0A941CTZ7_9BACI|nr:ATPase [Allobacillus saliphilus]MBR7553086.1 ATPase [Allobacillus saliphilus]